MSGVVLNVNGQAATRINATKITGTLTAVCLNCEGDQVWFPANTVRDNFNGTFDIQNWIYNQKFK